MTECLSLIPDRRVCFCSQFQRGSVQEGQGDIVEFNVSLVEVPHIVAEEEAE